MSVNVAVLEIIEELKASKNTIRCSRVVELLHGLGFDIRDGKRGGHKIVTHDGLEGFYSTSFDCGHGRNPEIKAGYIGNILKLLMNYEADL